MQKMVKKKIWMIIGAGSSSRHVYHFNQSSDVIVPASALPPPCFICANGIFICVVGFVMCLGV